MDGNTIPNEEDYFQLLAEPIRMCSRYRPMFGQGQDGGLTLDEFRSLYGADLFYHWVGLDSPLMYAAHRVAGGMTSIYRQVGIGCERLLRRLLVNTLGLSEEQATWEYLVPASSGKPRRLSLDGRIDFDNVRDDVALRRVRRWVSDSAERALVPPEARTKLKGAVFEVRQGYKSMDSKRQNADIANASSAYAHGYIPVLLLFSSQIDEDLIERYAEARWVILRGVLPGSSVDSTFSFAREVLGYDLAAFLERNSHRLKAELESVASSLLAPR